MLCILYIYRAFICNWTGADELQTSELQSELIANGTNCKEPLGKPGHMIKLSKLVPKSVSERCRKPFGNTCECLLSHLEDGIIHANAHAGS